MNEVMPSIIIIIIIINLPTNLARLGLTAVAPLEQVGCDLPTYPPTYLRYLGLQ